MQIRTTDGSVIANVAGTFEDAYTIALHFWAIAGAEGVHMDGLQITEAGKIILEINYTTHER